MMNATRDAMCGQKLKKKKKKNWELVLFSAMLN